MKNLAARSCGGMCAFWRCSEEWRMPSSWCVFGGVSLHGNRTAVWIVAQLHILFAAFILGAPIFVVISEWMGYRKQEPRYDRLAKEVTR